MAPAVAAPAPFPSSVPYTMHLESSEVKASPELFALYLPVKVPSAEHAGMSNKSCELV